MTEKLYRVDLVAKPEYPNDMPPKCNTMVVVAEGKSEALSKVASYTEEKVYVDFDEVYIHEEGYFVK